MDEKILLADDEAGIRKVLAISLADSGYEVLTAENGEEAFEIFLQTKPQIVLTDIKMPGMDGLEVTERIKARCPWTPVVVITGYGTEANESKASVLGASGFVRKPLTRRAIAIAVNNDKVTQRHTALDWRLQR